MTRSLRRPGDRDRSLLKQTGSQTLIWICVLSVVTVLAASASIWGTVDDRRDMGTGHPSFETLVSYTGIWRRDVFAEILGEPDAMDRFAAAPERIQELPVSRWIRLFDNTLTDITSIMLSVMAPLLWGHNATIAIALLAVGAVSQVVGYGIAAIVAYRSGIWRKWLREDQA